MTRRQFGRVCALLAIPFGIGAQVYVSQPAPVKDVASSASASAVPGSAVFAGGNSSGNLAGLVACDSSAQLTVSTATTTQIVALAGSKSVYVCGFVINGGGSTTGKLVSGTGTNCATGSANLTPAFNLAPGSTVSLGTGLGYVIKAAPGAAVCLTNSAAIAVNVFVSYTQF